MTAARVPNRPGFKARTALLARLAARLGFRNVSSLQTALETERRLASAINQHAAELDALRRDIEELRRRPF